MDPAARSRLLELLRQDGILHASATQPVLSRDGTSARWMLDSLAVTLTPEGGALAARCLLALLARFEGTQLATLGTTGIPLVEACVLASGGRYRGLLVRKEQKKHGSRKWIEGPIDPREPVVIVDDSVSSGLSMNDCREKLEAAGLRVEGGVSLVRFGFDAGTAFMQERGYHMEAVFDIWDDFIAAMDGETRVPANPSKVFPEIAWDPAPAQDGLHPAALARQAIGEWLARGRVPAPPERLDRPYDAAGGAWVSVRSRANVHVRHARDGFWHLPDDEGEAPPAPRAVVLAAVRTAEELKKQKDWRAALDSSGVAVTFFSALERCAVGALDNGRYGIVVRSRERRGRMGGALPRMPGITGEWRQFEHARRKNARLYSFEPFDLFRHEVVKVVEPGAEWPRSGAPMAEDEGRRAAQERIARRAREHVQARLAGEAASGGAHGSAPLQDGAFWPRLDSIFLSIYVRGRLRGCMGTRARAPERDLAEVAASALADARFTPPLGAEDAEAVAVVLSFLEDPLEIGACSPEEVTPYFAHGRQALMCWQGSRMGLLLPSVAIAHDLGPAAFAREVVDKAGITRPPYRWCRFDCTSWLCDGAGARVMEGAWPAAPAREEPLGEAVARLGPLLLGYLERNCREDGTLFARYRPFADAAEAALDLPRLAHGAWVLARARSPAARRTIDLLLGKVAPDAAGNLWLASGDAPPSIAEVSFLLLALLELGRESETAGGLARTLASAIDVHGKLATHRDEPRAVDAFQDYFPGEALLALGAAREAGLADVPPERIEAAFRFYRHRFRYRRHWGQVAWLLQAFASWWRTSGDARFADFVLEVADWALEYQLAKSGAFVNDHQSETPGYTSALYLEGLAAALGLVAALPDEARRARYLDAAARGVRFLDRLVIQERDAPVLPNAARAQGGVRPSMVESEVRIDFVQHALAAVLGLAVVSSRL